MRSREEARLERVFRSLLLLSAAGSPLACGSPGAVGGRDGGTQIPVDGGTQLPVDGSVVDATQSGDASAADVGAPEGDGTITDAAEIDDAAIVDGTAPDATPTVGPYGYSDAACDPVVTDAARCTVTESLPCGLPPDAQVENCYLLITQCEVLCGEDSGQLCGISECLQSEAGTMPTDAAALTLECATGLIACGIGVGRRPEGFANARPRAQSGAIGAFLADMARLEAASVFAFRRLRDELSAMRAPRRFVRKAERCARDEVRHARVTTRLARRRGALPGSVVAPARLARSIEAFATENAIEGCVRESFGALMATRQASLARDPEIRREMRAIAVDETRHAALAWEVARWAHGRLDTDARARVRLAAHDAVRSLRDEAAAAPHDLAFELGLPVGAEARALVDAFAAVLLGSRPRLARARDGSLDRGSRRGARRG